MSSKIALIPPSGRWSISHKARLVNAVARGELSLVELVDAGVSVEEFIGWKNAFASRGREGLRVYKRYSEPQVLRSLCADLGVRYVVSPDGAAISCGRCGLTSRNPNDVANRYCGHCKAFHDEEPHR